MITTPGDAMKLKKLSLILALLPVFSPIEGYTAMPITPYEQGSYVHCCTLLEHGRKALVSSFSSGNHEKTFDDAQDFLEDAYTIARRHLTDFEMMITKQYLVILGAIYAARQGYLRKHRYEALDKLELARDQLINNLRKVALQETDFALQHRQVHHIIKALSLLVEASIYLASREHTNSDARRFLTFARETAHKINY
jgi:hypothetical protein